MVRLGKNNFFKSSILVLIGLSIMVSLGVMGIQSVYAVNKKGAEDNSGTHRRYDSDNPSGSYYNKPYYKTGNSELNNNSENYAYNECSSGERGALWVSNSDNYYHSGVVVKMNDDGLSIDNTVDVTIRGSFFTCKKADVKTLNATSIKDNNGLLTGIDSDAILFRGNALGKYNWSTKGGSLKATLNIKDVAINPPYNQKVTVDLYRCPVTAGGIKGTGDSCYPTEISINVKRIPKDFILTPSVSVSRETIEQDMDEAVTVKPSIDNEGGTVSFSVKWRLKKIVLKPGMTLSKNSAGNSSNLPCEYYTGLDDSPNCTNVDLSDDVVFPKGVKNLGTINEILNYPVGTKICYTLSVYKRASQNFEAVDQWAHSSPDCVTVAKKSKVNVIGGDLWSGGGIFGSTRQVGTKTFGSWGEYGVFANGDISGFTSSAAYSTGAAASASCATINKLSFASKNPCNVSDLGSFDSPKSDIGEKIKNLYADKYNSGNKLLGEWTITGTEVIYRDNVFIEGNQSYASGQGLGKSQLIIIAKNTIYISPSVTDIDGWLIAGTIDTCIGGEVGPCKKNLTINGPVIAGTLLMHRTGGDTASTTGYSETFKLPASTYLWAANQATQNALPRTVYTTELSPRF